MRRRALVPLAALAALAAPPAFAAGPAEAQLAAAAQLLYDQAVASMRSGALTAACPKLEQVVELAPSAVGAKLALADCYERDGRLASAWMAYAAAEGAASSAGQRERQKTAHDRAAALRPRLATLVVEVPEAVRALPGLEVRRDGAVLAPVAYGLPFPIDRGRHVITAAASGRQRWEGAVEIAADGASAKLLVDGLAPAPAEPPPRPTARPFWSSPRVAGAAVGGAGLVALGLGSFFGVRALQNKSDSNAGPCDAATNRCTAAGVALRDQAFTASYASTGFFVAGGAALVTGVVLLVAGARAPSAAARLVVGPGSLGVAGSF
jgi:hypothetical protein